jgi:hypothetical protein
MNIDSPFGGAVKIFGMRFLPFSALLAADGLSTQKLGEKWRPYFSLDRPRGHGVRVYSLHREQ